MTAAATAGNVTRDPLPRANRGRSETRWDETRLPRDEWEHVSRGCFCTAEVLTQLHKRLLAPLLLFSFSAPRGTLNPLTVTLLSSVPSSGSLILRRRRHPPLPRPRTYFSSYFIFICFSPPRPPALVPSPPLLPLSPARRCTPPSPRTSFRIIFILSSAILVNAIPPVVREPFFYFAFDN